LGESRYHLWMDSLIQLDHLLFHKINQAWTHPSLDELMPFITSFQKTWWIFVILLLYATLKNAKQALLALVAVLIAVGISDFTASQVIKPLVKRDRPSFALGDSNVRLLVPKQSSPSFPSNHAANLFSIAMMGSILFPPISFLLWPLAFAVAFSRVYVGVHFPLDVFGGAIFGILVALFVYRTGLNLRRVFRMGEHRRIRPIPRDVPKKPRWKKQNR
jgi:undecaprenyl-diphosphatase